MHLLIDPLAHPVIAHRGNRAHAPENTTEAFRQALALGVDAVEFDLRVTRDGALVLMHDATVDRTTNGMGAVADMSLDDVRRLDAGATFTKDGGRTFPYRGRGIVVPTFDEVVETVIDRPLLIELKVTEATEPLRAAIARHNIAPRVLVAGFSASATHPLRNAGFPLGAATSDAARALPRALLGLSAGDVPYQAMCLPPRWHGVPVPLALLARSLRKVDRVLHVWTVNDPAVAVRYWANGVHGIISDDPAVIMRARG